MGGEEGMDVLQAQIHPITRPGTFTARRRRCYATDPTYLGGDYLAAQLGMLTAMVQQIN